MSPIRDDGTLTDLSTPLPVTDLELAFPTNVRHLMPPYDDIPEEYRRTNGGPDERSKKYHQFVADWFFLGLADVSFDFNEGIDGEAMMRHIRAIMGSFEPKHEHKEAAVAYLLSLWSKDVKWKPNTRRR